MLPFVAKLAKLPQVVTNRHEYRTQPQEGKGTAQPKSQRITVPNTKKGQSFPILMTNER